MVGVNISHSYFHPGGAHITWVKIISHTSGTAGKVVEFSLRMPAVLGSSPVVTGQKFHN